MDKTRSWSQEQCRGLVTVGSPKQQQETLVCPAMTAPSALLSQKNIPRWTPQPHQCQTKASGTPGPQGSELLSLKVVRGGSSQAGAHHSKANLYVVQGRASGTCLAAPQPTNTVLGPFLSQSLSTDQTGLEQGLLPFGRLGSHSAELKGYSCLYAQEWCSGDHRRCQRFECGSGSLGPDKSYLSKQNRGGGQKVTPLPMPFCLGVPPRFPGPPKARAGGLESPRQELEGGAVAPENANSSGIRTGPGS